MTKPSTEQLKETLQQLIKQHNEAVEVQKNCKERIIATQAVIQDREDGDTNDTDSHRLQRLKQYLSLYLQLTFHHIK